MMDVPPEEMARCLDECGAAMLAEAEVARPPVDMVHLAARLGFVVAVDRSMRGRARLVRLSGRGQRRPRNTILISPETRGERRQWAVAHELSEATAHRVFAALGIGAIDAPPSAREQIANRLAGCLLLPRAWFDRDGQAVAWCLPELKAIYRTASHELIARRMLEMTPPAVISVFDQSQLTWRRSNVPGRPPNLTPLERTLWQECHSHERSTTGHDDVVQIDCWPIHEPGRKREIMRSEVQPFD